jgi:spermidine synthase
MDSRSTLRYSLYALFMLSGFAGLIYESIWTQYLRLFLGHAAYAQTLVLALFMGGMAVGAWLTGGISRRLQRPLLWYAVIEALLALAAFGFDPMFRSMQHWALNSAFPALGAPVAIETLKWSLSALSILPQCVLLGATFPLVSASLMRIAPTQTGHVLAWLYFSNSLGASFGVLVSGFVLISWAGLPGTLLTAGLINALLAVVVWQLQRLPAIAGALPLPEPARGTRSRLPLMMFAAAAISGGASFMYEIGWIRMLSLVLGSATHSFELMLSAFILGLALGSFWIRKRLDGLRDPVQVLGWIQVAMATLALLSLPLYEMSFDVMAAFLESVQRNAGGYALFNLVSHGICLALMLPVTICAGMTLPLMTHILVRNGYGEAAIGRVYASNTLGSIVGVLIAVHLVMPLLGLRQVVVLGAVADFALGLWLLHRAATFVRLPRAAIAAAVSLVCLGLIVFHRFDPAQLASGVYRTGQARQSAEVIFHADGKTASVSVARYESGMVTIATNGKADAALREAYPTSDDYTQILLGAIPLLLHPDPRDVAVVGFGSGRSTHVTLADPRVQAVDSIEIEPVMVEGARHFGPLVAAAFDDPRSRIHLEDARTFFARHQRRYDVIISEPSNPWVSGVASLFSKEFYVQQKRFLKPGGLFVQWLQLYEMNLPLAASVMGALGTAFDDYALYLSYSNDLVIVASAGAAVPPLQADAFDRAAPPLRELLDFIDIRRAPDLEIRGIGNKRELAAWFRSTDVPANSDYFPFLERNAVEQRFLQSDVGELAALFEVLPRLRAQDRRRFDITPTNSTEAAWRTQQAASIARRLSARGSVSVESAPSETAAREALVLSTIRDRCLNAQEERIWLSHFQEFVGDLMPYLSPGLARDMAAGLRSGRCFDRTAPAIGHWIGLMESAAGGDDAAVIRHALVLLQGLLATEPIPVPLAREVLLAELRQNDPAAALDFLQAFGTRIPQHPAVDYLITLLRGDANAL